MGLKPDHWIRKMANERKMIEPFTDSQVRNGVISYGVSSYGYDVRVADEFKIFTNVFGAIVDPKNFRSQKHGGFCRRSLRDPAKLIRAGAHGGIFPYSAQSLDDLSWQINVCALRHYCQRYAVRAGMGGIRHTRNLEHDSTPSPDLRQ